MRIDTPKLTNIGDAIQANQSMMSAFSSLGNQSQDYLKMEEQKKNNEWNRAFDTQKMDLETNKYNTGLQEKADAKSANLGTLKALYPAEYGNLSNTMGNNPNLLGNVDIGNVQSYNTNIAKATKDKEDTLYQAGRDKINDGFERERIGISRANASKPSELDRIMAILAPKLVTGANGGQDLNIPKENEQTSYMQPTANINTNNSTALKQPQAQQPQPQTQINPQVVSQTQQPLKVGVSNQKYGIGDYLTKGAEDTLREEGNVYKSNPLTGTTRLIEKAPEKGVLETTKLRNELNDEKISIESTIKNSDKFIENLDGLINNPNLKYATGITSFLGKIPDTPYKDIHVAVEVMKGGAFASAIEGMKGLGGMSDADAKGITSSIANLDMSQSEESLKKQLGSIAFIMKLARGNAIKKLKDRGVDYNDSPQNTDAFEQYRTKK